MSDEGLRQAYTRALEARAPADRGACPAPEAILALVRRQGDEEQRLARLDHVMACAACRNEFELLRAIERAGAQAEQGETRTADTVAVGAAPGRGVGHITWRRWAPIAAAAAVVLVLALGPGRRLWEPGTEPVRGGGESVALVAPADAAMPSDAPLAFVWHRAPGAERYTLELLTGGGVLALSRTTADTALTVPLPPNLAPGDYRWWVIATAADGSEIHSDTRTLRLRAR